MSFELLIIGAGRGGTSLLAGLLDFHPMLEVGFEKHPRKNLIHGKVPPAPTAIGASIHDLARGFLADCIAESEKVPKQIWANKITTEQLQGLMDHNRPNPDDQMDAFEFFFHDVMKAIKVLFILRDGRTCVRSKMSRKGIPVAEACARWRFSVEVYRFLESSHSNRHLMRFEELLAEPRGVLTDVCEFIGIPFKEKMLEGTRNSKMRSEYQQRGIDASKLDLDGIPDGCIELIEDDLRYCGYL